MQGLLVALERKYNYLGLYQLTDAGAGVSLYMCESRGTITLCTPCTV